MVQPKRPRHVISQMGKAIAIVTSGSFGVHVTVMLLDYYLVKKPLYINLQGDFVGSVFSSPMIPIMGAYGIFLLVIYFLWQRLEKAMLLAQEKEVQSEREKASLESMQRITAIVSEHISVHNAEIMKWVAFKRQRRQQVSERVEQASKKIATALRSLSEIAFVSPYTDELPKDVGEIEKMLRSKLEDLSQYERSQEETGESEKG